MKLEGIIKEFMEPRLEAFRKNAEGKLIARSVHYIDKTRFIIADEMVKKPINDPSKVEIFLRRGMEALGLDPQGITIVDPKAVDFKELQAKYQLQKEDDVLFIKFSKDGHVVVLGEGITLNFTMPKSIADYNQKIWHGEEWEWRYNSAGILLHSVGGEYDTSRIILIPLIGLDKSGYTRTEIKRAVGNYLIEECKIPIIDAYSHNYEL